MTAYMLERGGSGQIAYDLYEPTAAIAASTGSPLIVCIPGMGDLRGTYRFIGPLLAARGYRVAAMDLRGHGASSVGWPAYDHAAIASDVIALIDALGGGPAVIVGNSFGGGVAVYVAATAPERVRAVVLVDAFTRAVPTSTTQKLGVWAMGVAGRRLWPSYLRRLYVTTPPADLDAYVRGLAASLREPGRWDAVRALLRVKTAALEPLLGQVRVPALIVFGSKDPDFADPAAEVREIRGRLTAAPCVEVAMIDGAGHYPQAETPDATGAAMLAFLAALDAAPRQQPEAH